jgi:AbrB family looped-hinge helix DNA binding protein
MIALRFSLDKEKEVMEVVTISSKYQVVIPRDVRKQFEVKPAQKNMFITYNGTFRVVVVPPIKKARGMLKDISTENIREGADERH